MIASLLIGAVLAACALAFILTPLVIGPSRRSPSAATEGGSRRWVSTDGPTAEATAVDVLREIEFDRATGKLSEADYGTLKSAYTARALAELRAPAPPSLDNATVPSASKASEVVTPAACPACQAHTVAGAAYCINCGHYLSERCPGCGAAVAMAAARYCSECGVALSVVVDAGR